MHRVQIAAFAFRGGPGCPEPMLAGLVRGCIAIWPSLLARPLINPATAFRQGRRAQLHVVLALICEQTVYSSLLMRSGPLLADPKPMLSRLIRGCIAIAFTSTAPANQMNPAPT